MILKVTNTGNNNEYHFWDYKSGDSPSNRQTTDASASGTGVKYAYYATATQANGLYLAGARLGVTVKTGPTVFTPMWIEALFTP
jgi:hypothetical protein